MNIKEFYNTLDENYDSILDRLISPDRIEKYLNIFFNDNSIGNLKQQIENKDFEIAKNTAHTLKGAISTLGIDRLVSVISKLQTALENNEAEQANDLFQSFEEEYERIFHIWTNAYIES